MIFLYYLNTCIVNFSPVLLKVLRCFNPYWLLHCNRIYPGKGVNFNGNLDKNRIEHLFFNLLSYTDENMNIQKSNIDDIVTELSDILMTSAKATFGLKNTRNCINKSPKQWNNGDCKQAKQLFRKSYATLCVALVLIFSRRLLLNLIMFVSIVFL
jgi:hypothetical protein